MSKQHEQALLFLRKAEDDAALVDEVCSSQRVTDEIVGFHCQQAGEKLLKALLSECGVPFPKTHNLRLLMDLLVDAGQPLPPDFDDLDVLTPFGTVFRYEDLPTEAVLDRGRAVKLVAALRAYAQRQLARGETSGGAV